MGFQISVAIGYKDIFNDFDTIRFEELIHDIPTKNSLQIIGYFMAQLHSRGRRNDLQIEFLKMWVARLPVEIHKTIEDFINRTKTKNSKFSFLDNTSMLILANKLLENYNDLEILPDLNPEQELRLFKSYLFCSQEWIDKQAPNFEKSKIKNEEDVIKILLPSQLPYQEVMELKDFR